MEPVHPEHKDHDQNITPGSFWGGLSTAPLAPWGQASNVILASPFSSQQFVQNSSTVIYQVT